MTIGWPFILNSVLLGVGLAMDAFSVSLANGLHEPGMRMRRRLAIAGTFAGFQFAMPLLGWLCVHALEERFAGFAAATPWIALALLLFLGIRMIAGALRERGGGEKPVLLIGAGTLLLQGVATSIDALSVGFTIAAYPAAAALAAALIIAAVTLLICLAGLAIGRRFAAKLAWRSGILGGVILIAVGLEIFIKGVLL